MVNLLKIIIAIVNKKEVYGTVVAIALAYFVYQTLSIILDEIINYGKNLYEKKKRTTITSLLQNIIKYLTLITTVIVLLGLYGINVKGMIAGVGVAATILGLALQDTFKDIINGVSIILENYFIVGDIVTYNDFTGTVVDFGLRTTKIRNAESQILTVANRNILEIKNLSQKDQSIYLKVGLPYEEDIKKIEDIINNKIIPQIAKVENIIPDTTQYLGIDELSDSSVQYLLTFRCKREKHWQARRDANRIILDTLNKNNVSVPYPQLEVHYDS